VVLRIWVIVVLGLYGLLSPAAAAPPSPTAITPELIAAAKQEGAVVWYTSIELQTAEKLAKSFEAAYPGVKVQVLRTSGPFPFRAGNDLGRTAMETAVGVRHQLTHGRRRCDSWLRDRVHPSLHHGRSFHQHAGYQSDGAVLGQIGANVQHHLLVSFTRWRQLVAQRQ